MSLFQRIVLENNLRYLKSYRIFFCISYNFVRDRGASKFLKKLFYRSVKPFIKCFIYAVYKPRIEGLENIPTTGKLILAGNHTDNLDSLLLLSAIDRPIHFLGKHTLFKGIGKYIFDWMGVIPVNRQEENPKAKESALEVLNGGEVIGIFPEGTINRTSKTIMPFKFGAVSLARKSHSSIVPFAIDGHYRAFRRELKIVFGNPITVDSRDLVVQNDQLMREVEILVEGMKK